MRCLIPQVLGLILASMLAAIGHAAPEDGTAEVRRGTQKMEWPGPLEDGKSYTMTLVVTNKDSTKFKTGVAKGTEPKSVWKRPSRTDLPDSVHFYKELKSAEGTKIYRPVFGGSYVIKPGNGGPAATNPPTWTLNGKYVVIGDFLAYKLEVDGQQNKVFSVHKDKDGSEYQKPGKVFYLDKDLDGGACDREAGDEKNPICFSKASKMKVKVSIKILDDALEVTSAKIRGTSPLGKVPEHSANVSGREIVSASFINLPKFENEVSRTAAFTIDWEVEVDDEEGWVPAGSTDHEVFVVNAKPDSTKRYRTVLYHATRNGGKNKTEYLTNTWQSFKNLKLTRWNGELCGEYSVPLKYYVTDGAPCTLLNLLLSRPNPDGVCLAFGQMFSECLKVNNVRSALFGFFAGTQQDGQGVPTFVNLADGSRSRLEYIVKSKIFGRKFKSFYQAWPFKQFPYVQKNNCLDDANGLPGQNNRNPSQKFFSRHVVVSVTTRNGRKFYDPSYGKVYTGLANFRVQILEGYYTWVALGQQVILNQRIRESAMQGNQPIVRACRLPIRGVTWTGVALKP